MDVGRRYDSYFQTFLQALRSSGSITETAARFLIAHSGTLVLSGLSQGIAQELSQFMQMLSVGPEELLALLQNPDVIRRALQRQVVRCAAGCFAAQPLCRLENRYFAVSQAI